MSPGKEVCQKEMGTMKNWLWHENMLGTYGVVVVVVVVRHDC